MEEFSGAVGGPCDFGCTTNQSGAMEIRWNVSRTPLFDWTGGGGASSSNTSTTPQTPLAPTNSWKLCFDPKYTHTDDDNSHPPPVSSPRTTALQCAAPAPVCHPDAFFYYLAVAYLAALVSLVLSFAVCCCGQCLGRCCDVCCLVSAGTCRLAIGE